MDSYFLKLSFNTKEVKKIRKQITLAVLVGIMVLAAGGASVVSAQEDFMDPNESNNEATVSIEAFEEILLLPITPSIGNVTTGGDSSILSPSSSQHQGPVQTQTQTSINTNNNSLTNTNTNVAVSTSSATNTNRISNNNTFNPTLVISNRNSVGNNS